MKYWAIDPGPTPGMACVHDGLRGFETWLADDVETCLYMLWDNCADHVVKGIACEDFVLSGGGRPKTPAGSKTTIEVIGAIKWVCEYHRTPLSMQKPGDASDFSTNDKLKAMGWETPSKPDHQRSAARHLLLYLVKKGEIDAARLLSLVR